MGDTALARALRLHCMQVTGGFRITPADDLPCDTGSLLLISPSEPEFWPHFTTAPEYSDGMPNPLDRWSRRIGDQLAQDFEARALYPFGGPPFQPFYTWALRSGRAWASPIGFLVHDTGGLFISYRMALLVPWRASVATGQPPCDTCEGNPCATACPAGAFIGGYDVPACKGHLHSDEGQDCMAQGCAARRACPVGQGTRLPAQAQFHMKDFL